MKKEQIQAIISKSGVELSDEIITELATEANNVINGVVKTHKDKITTLEADLATANSNYQTTKSSLDDIQKQLTVKDSEIGKAGIKLSLVQAGLSPESQDDLETLADLVELKLSKGLDIDTALTQVYAVAKPQAQSQVEVTPNTGVETPIVPTIPTTEGSVGLEQQDETQMLIDAMNKAI